MSQQCGCTELPLEKRDGARPVAAHLRAVPTQPAPARTPVRRTGCLAVGAQWAGALCRIGGVCGEGEGQRQAQARPLWSSWLHGPPQLPEVLSGGATLLSSGLLYGFQPGAASGSAALSVLGPSGTRRMPGWGSPPSLLRLCADLPVGVLRTGQSPSCQATPQTSWARSLGAVPGCWLLSAPWGFQCVVGLRSRCLDVRATSPGVLLQLHVPSLRRTFLGVLLLLWVSELGRPRPVSQALHASQATIV